MQPPTAPTGEFDGVDDGKLERWAAPMYGHDAASIRRAYLELSRRRTAKARERAAEVPTATPSAAEVRDALEGYTLTGYKGTNPWLRGGEPPPSVGGLAAAPRIKAEVAAIDAAMRPSTRDRVLYRRTDLHQGDFSEWKPGTVVSDPAFVSTTAHRGGLTDDAFGDYKLTVRVPKGTPLVDLNGYTSEREVLLARGVDMRVVKVDHAKKTAELEVLPKSEPGVPAPAQAGATPDADLDYDNDRRAIKRKDGERTLDEPRLRRLAGDPTDAVAQAKAHKELDRRSRVVPAVASKDSSWEDFRASMDQLAQGDSTMAGIAQMQMYRPARLHEGLTSKDEYGQNLRRHLEDLRSRVDPNNIHIAVPADRIESILKQGRFKSMHERAATGRGGRDYRASRNAAEEILQGVDPNTGKRDKPIYGWTSDAEHLESLTRSVASNYGAVQVRLKPDVAKRSTVAFGDSLDEALRPVRMDQVGEASHDRLLQAAGKGTATYAAESGRRAHESNYNEVQVHGGVSTSDIAAIRLPRITGEEPEYYARLTNMRGKEGDRIRRARAAHAGKVDAERQAQQRIIREAALAGIPVEYYDRGVHAYE